VLVARLGLDCLEPAIPERHAHAPRNGDSNFMCGIKMAPI